MCYGQIFIFDHEGCNTCSYRLETMYDYSSYTHCILCVMPTSSTGIVTVSITVYMQLTICCFVPHFRSPPFQVRRWISLVEGWNADEPRIKPMIYVSLSGGCSKIVAFTSRWYLFSDPTYMYLSYSTLCCAG